MERTLKAGQCHGITASGSPCRAQKVDFIGFNQSRPLVNLPWWCHHHKSQEPKATAV